ncbi:MAG: enoyl-CoA hydratase/isomerase family protein [Rhodospirillaceae bacterium]|nr:enoyl-CoA hydratase/isomerase family protein [Rhodospirillaceae bacterium]
MKFRYVEWSKEPAGAAGEASIGYLTLNRPDRRNAIGPRMAFELDAMMDRVLLSGVQVVVVRGAGGNFCAGGDLKEEAIILERPEDTLGIHGELGEVANWLLNDHVHVVAQRALRKLEELPQPVIASVDGVAVGGGFELAIACDLRIVSDRVRMAEVAVPAGFVSEWSCPRNLPKLIGLSRAVELILTGRFLNAEEAREIGLVNKVVPADRLDEETAAMARMIARLPPGSVRSAKELIKLYNQDNRSPERSSREIDRVMEATRSDHAAATIRMLLEKSAAGKAG